jgi:hypothetical protein
MKHIIKSAFQAVGYDIVKFRDSKITKPVDESYLEILHDPVFQASVAEVSETTLLDTARLANLWLLCRVSNPTGSIIEIGSYKGVGRFISGTVRQSVRSTCATHSKDSATL